MKKIKVVLGLSGGVDSSVAALILNKKSNIELIASFMRNWDSMLNNDLLGNKDAFSEICPQEIDYFDAVDIATKLNIKIYRIDFVKEYWEYVFKYFIDEYKNGRTPNPDILCNKYIKFDKFLNYALTKWNADFIATGHYAKIRFNKKINEYELLKAKDINKDQTYFLCMLNQKQLSKTMFPIGNLEKKEVRKIAKENNLITANKKDSTGICFIGERKFKEFLKNYIPNLPGEIKDINTNKKIGMHDGIMYYTIGQRKGLNLGGMKEKYFVVGKNIKKKILYVSNENQQKWLFSNKCIISNVNFINSKYLELDSFECNAIFRYRQNEIKVIVKKNENNNYEISFNNYVKSITSGQFASLYINEVCIGGGVIIASFNDKIKLEYFDFN